MIKGKKQWPTGIWLAWIGWFLILLGFTWHSVKKTDFYFQQIQLLKSQLNQVKNYSTLHSQLEKRIEQLQIKLNSFSAIVSYDSTQPGFIETIQSIAKEHDIRIHSFKPVKYVEYEQAVEVLIYSQYDQIGRFINRLERHSRLYRIPFFSLETVDRKNKISATLVIVGGRLEKSNAGP